MIVSTHIMISQKLYDVIDDFMGVKLDKKYFAYGNIKPDIAYSLFRKSHTLKESMDFVIYKTRNLIYDKNITLKQFSTDLGIITHFISDFFCSPHYYENTIYKKLVDHINYEINLHNEFKKMERMGLLNIGDIENQLKEFSKECLQNTILTFEESYLSNKLSIKNDILHSLIASSVASIHIIERAKLFVNRKIAA